MNCSTSASLFSVGVTAPCRKVVAAPVWPESKRFFDFATNPFLLDRIVVQMCGLWSTNCDQSYGRRAGAVVALFSAGSGLSYTGGSVPEVETIERAREDAREGKSPSTQAGEFVREEMHHVREGKHGARSTKQAIAIGLSKARRSGVKLRPPKRRAASARTRRQAARETAKARKGGVRKASRKRATAVRRALKREGHSAASRSALARQARSSARRRGPAQRSAAARRAARTRARNR